MCIGYVHVLGVAVHVYPNLVKMLTVLVLTIALVGAMNHSGTSLLCVVEVWRR